MENYADFLSTPPMYRDIGSTFLAYQMPVPMVGMPYVGGGYGISPMKPALSADKFEAIQRKKEKDKAQTKKVLGIVGGAIAAAVTLTVLKKKVPAVNNALSKAGTWIKNLFKKAPAATP